MSYFTVVGFYHERGWDNFHEPLVDHVEADTAQEALEQVIEQRGKDQVEVVAVFAGHLQSQACDWDNRSTA